MDARLLNFKFFLSQEKQITNNRDTSQFTTQRSQGLIGKKS